MEHLIVLVREREVGCRVAGTAQEARCQRRRQLRCIIDVCDDTPQIDPFVRRQGICLDAWCPVGRQLGMILELT